MLLMKTETAAAMPHRIARAAVLPVVPATIRRATSSITRVCASAATISRTSTTVITAELEKPAKTARAGTAPVR